MKTLVITNDYFPKKGGISTYIKSFEDHLEFEKIIYNKIKYFFDILYLYILNVFKFE